MAHFKVHRGHTQGTQGWTDPARQVPGRPVPARQVPARRTPGQPVPVQQIPVQRTPLPVALPAPRPLARRVPGPAGRWLAGFWRRHRLITIAVGVSAVPRVLAARAFRPALFTPDSFGYLAEGVHLAPGQTRPSGYPIMLRLLEPFHSLLLITTVQHVMGIATAVCVYGLLRRWDLPAWGAVLAACPVLFDPRQMVLESSILPDTLYAVLLTVAVALLITKRGPAPGRCALAGLLLAGAAICRGNGVVEIAAALAVLLIWRAGWRAVIATAAAFAVPLLAYMGVFAAKYGNFALTDSDGMFAWSRTMSFANCAVIRPPAALRPLCPDRQSIHPVTPTPAWSLSPMLGAPSPAEYLWAPRAWWRHDADPGINATNNALASRFALDAVRAQPGGYLRTVASGVMQTFLATDRSQSVRALHFTPVPDVPRLAPVQARHLYAYSHTTSATHQVQPYAYFLYLYQLPVYFPGILFALAVVAGLAGVIRDWRRRGGPAALPWAVAAVGIVAPVAMHEYHYRYAIPVVPLACLAAGLAFTRGRARSHRAAPTAVPGAAQTITVRQVAGRAPLVGSGTHPAQPHPAATVPSQGGAPAGHATGPADRGPAPAGLPGRPGNGDTQLPGGHSSPAPLGTGAQATWIPPGRRT